jgi:hypothetical protein
MGDKGKKNRERLQKQSAVKKQVEAKEKKEKNHKDLSKKLF